MDNVKKWIDAHLKFRNIESITTDAVHRRFVRKKEPEPEDYYYCKQCDERIKATTLKEELKSHFENRNHEARYKCIYCTTQVYEYYYKGDVVLYHACSHLK